MKKTTWAIIGLSLCVVVLATALGVVLLQKKTETIIIREPEREAAVHLIVNRYSKPWERFSIAPYPINILERKGLAETYIYNQVKVTHFFIVPGKKVGVIEPNK